MAYNTILIKRRVSGAAGAPSALSGGELAFNEVDSTLYYGSSAGVISIAGDGAFVNRTSDQTILGDKTFLGSTTLSSTTFSSNSDLDFGGNILTNIGTPISATDAATKQYVDEVANSSTTATDDLSAEVYNTFVKLTDDRAVDLSGGLTVSSGISADTVVTTGNADIGGNLTVTGDLVVLGETTTIETTTTMTSAFTVTNAGSGPALTVTQTGATDVAAFYDGDEAHVALIIKDGGNVGIGTDAPNEKLTVVGNISATGTIYSDGGMEISSGGGDTTLFIEDGKVGINTEAPNEALTVVGSVSATEDIYAVNSVFTGTLDVDGGATFGSALSAAGNLTIDGTSSLVGAVTLSDNLSGNGTSSTISGFILDGGSF